MNFENSKTLPLPMDSAKITTMSSTTSLPSLQTSKPVTIAAERWNVEKKRIELDKEIESLYDQQVAKCLKIDKIANDRASKLYNDIYYKVKWSNPSLPVPQQKLFIDYCKHLLTQGPKTHFAGRVDLKVWKRKLTGTVHEKLRLHIEKLCKKLHDIIDERDKLVQAAQTQLMTKTEELNIKKDAKIRWMMETNAGKKDEYFSLWYLAANCKLRELEVLLNSTTKMSQFGELGINARDPDFGLTPFHYACKNVKLQMVTFLMSQGADIEARAPDGRTPLHFAAAYATREIVLELLGACVDYDAIDNFGCTPLQLAEQNRNERTISTLRNWTKLTLTSSELLQHETEAAQGSGGGGGGVNDRSTFIDSPSMSEKTPSVILKLPPASPAGKRYAAMSGKLAAAGGGYLSPGTNSASAKQIPDGGQQQVQEEEEEGAANSNTRISMSSSREGAALGMSSPSLRVDAERDRPRQSDRRLLQVGEANSEYDDVDNDGNDMDDGHDVLDASIHVPTEYDLTQESILTKMSPTLLLLTKRLNAYNPYVVRTKVLAPETLNNPSELLRSKDLQRISGLLLEQSVQLTLAAAATTTATEDEKWQADTIQQYDGSFSEGRYDVGATAGATAGAGAGGSATINGGSSSLLRKSSSPWNSTFSIDYLSTTSTFGERMRFFENQQLEFENEFNECLAEIRLITRHYLLCVKESLIDEAVRSLRRRWAVSKRFWGLIQQEKSNARHRLAEEKAQQRFDMDLMLQEDQDSRELLSMSMEDESIDRLLIEQLDLAEASDHAIPPVTPAAAAMASESSSGGHPIGFGGSSMTTGDGPVVGTTGKHEPISASAPGLDGSSHEEIKRKSEDPLMIEENGDEVHVEEASALRVQSKTNINNKGQGGSLAESDDAEDDDDDRSYDSDVSLPPFDLEKISMMYDRAILTAQRAEEAAEAAAAAANTDRKNEEESIGRSLHRSQDYDSIGIDVYQIKENVFWETETARARMLATFAAAAGLDGESTGSGSGEASASLADMPQNELKKLEMKQLQEKHKQLSEIFQDPDEPLAVRVIKRWQAITSERNLRRPSFDVYNALYDEAISLRSEVTMSITAPDGSSTGGESYQISRPLSAKSESSSIASILAFSGPSLHTYTAPLQENIRGNFIVQLGLELAEVFVIRKEEGRAVHVILECLHVNEEIESTKKIDLLERMGDILLHIHDYLKLQEKVIDAANPLLNLNSRALDMIQAMEDVSSNIEKAGILLKNKSASPKQIEEVLVAEEEEEEQEMLLTPLKAPPEFSTNSTPLDTRFSLALDTALEMCIDITEQSIQLHRQHYQADLVEPVSFAMAMMQRTRALERLNKGEEALGAAQQAEVAAIRAVSGASEISIMAMLESLRLYVKYRLADANDLRYVSEKTHKVNEFIGHYSFFNIEKADQFARKSAEYLAISTIAVRNKEKQIADAEAAAKAALERQERKKLSDAQKSSSFGKMLRR